MLRSNLGLSLLALGLFGIAFGGISWASRGFPVGGTAAQVEPSLKPLERRDWTGLRPSDRKGSSAGVAQDDKGAGRNLMRLTAIQAANAYAQSPCDRAAKAAFIVASSTYIKSYAAVDDTRMRDAMQAAFAKGGVSKDEFPSDIQGWMAAITPSPDNSDVLCAAGRRADNLR